MASETSPFSDTAENVPSTAASDDDSIASSHHRFLSSSEWSMVAHRLGGVRDLENNVLAHTASSLWPPKGLPPGLYRDVVKQRASSFYMFHLTSTLRWALMILQLLLGAALTALGAVNFKNGIPVTILGAANTVTAGLLAFVQNSGLPDRFRYDMMEFEQVEDHIKEILESGIVPVGQALDDVVAQCFDMYRHAKATVVANKPVTYTPSNQLQGQTQMMARLSRSGPKAAKQTKPAVGNEIGTPAATS